MAPVMPGLDPPLEPGEDRVAPRRETHCGGRLRVVAGVELRGTHRLVPEQQPQEPLLLAAPLPREGPTKCLLIVAARPEPRRAP